MKYKHLSYIAAIGSLTLSMNSALARSGESTSDVAFACEIRNEVPVTVAQAGNNKQAIFHWKKDFLPQSKNPLELCKKVSHKLTGSYAEGRDYSKFQPRAIANGNSPMICDSQDIDNCDIVLLKLSPTEKAQATANEVLVGIMDKSLQANKEEASNLESERGLQSVSYPINLWELVLGRKLSNFNK